MLKSLVEWKNSSSRKPLILHGARQVGKTYIVITFGKRYYKNTVYINFLTQNGNQSQWTDCLLFYFNISIILY